MTDNRTNEPSEAQVEAAAKIIRRASLETTADPGDFWSDCYEEEREAWRNAARAALVAAQGVAPQSIGRLDLARHYWRSQGYDYDLHGLDGNNDYEMGLAVADAALAALAADQGAAPQAECDCGAGPGSAVCKKVCATRAPLPSSGVDEEKLAEVIGKARTTSVRDNDGVKSVVMESNEQIARAVAEWLKGQGGERRGE